MREIKFRAWDKNGEKMLYDVATGVITITDYSKFQHTLEEKTAKSDDCEFMQYTGLKDKNDKEIYEGDIVNVIDTDSKFGGRYENMKVDFYNAEFGIGDMMGHLGLKHLSEIEIIGNIYENPELLRGE